MEISVFGLFFDQKKLNAESAILSGYFSQNIVIIYELPSSPTDMLRRPQKLALSSSWSRHFRVTSLEQLSVAEFSGE